ncbi:immune inhibitor A, partial [candidate division WOR-3 bacterium]|nr:immune inhibitor A [candidate division WOR-3 bacterium]
MKVPVCVSLLIAVMLPIATASAGPMVVRVAARDYEELNNRIPFKGSSIDIAGAVPGESYDLVLGREDLGLVRSSGLEWRVITDDLDTREGDAWDFGYYCDYDSLVRIMRNWAATYPTLCKFDSIGRTHLGRWIYAVKISDNVHVEEDEPEVLLDAMHHSREWATPQAARHFADTLLSSYGTCPDITTFVNDHQCWVVPVSNVDGYDYDYPQQRMWRKNRKPYESAVGCDPNRDYNGPCDTTRMHAWGALVSGSRSTHYPGDETWMGARAWWADCVDALRGFFQEHTFVADVSLHSYGELVLWPFSSGVAPYDPMIATLAQGMASRMQRLGGGNYTAQQANYLYPSFGSSKDWMYGWPHNVGGYPCMAYTVELGTSFYQSTSQLDAIERECFDGVFYLFSQASAIISSLRGEVPPPVLAPMDSSATGSFTLHWTPKRRAYNQPTKWAVEELSGLTVSSDDFESGTALWDVVGFSRSSAQAHSGSHSMFSGMTNNQSNYIKTKDPYPVQPGDSVSFWLWYDLETNYDVYITEVSENGLDWVQLHDRYEGNSGGWQRAAFSLEPWAGRSVWLRFRVMSDDNTLRVGAYVDDVHPVPLFANRAVLSDNVTDTLYQVTGRTPGRYWYRVRGYNTAWEWNEQGPLEDVIVTGTALAEEPGQELRTGLAVSRTVSAGPFELSYSVTRPGEASLTVTDVNGRTVRTLVSGRVE